MTIQVDDAGSGDLLHGTVIGAYRPESDVFYYDLIAVKYFQKPLYREKIHLQEAKKITLSLVQRMKLKEKEKIVICTGDILNVAAEALLEEFGEDVVERGKIEGRGQYLVELAYTDELRNLGYEPIKERTEKWGKSFWHMYRWVRKNPRNRLKWTKSAFPNLKKYPLFQSR